jgi:hypothetical protein
MGVQRVHLLLVGEVSEDLVDALERVLDHR